MKKVLIISYFFPPCELTASQRPYGWAKHLKSLGYNPFIITRAWDHQVILPKDVGKSSLNKDVKIKKARDYQVHYTSFKSSLRDYLLHKHPKLKTIRKLLTFFELILQNFFLFITPYYKIYKESKRVIKEEKITKIIITGNPFNLFYIGYKLKKYNNEINWIADYRDDWTTSNLNFNHSLIWRLIKRLDTISEKKWVGSAEFITTVSQHYANKISNFIGLKSHVILNGFDDAYSQTPSKIPSKKEFIITYNGSLYPTQKIEPFAEVIKKIIIEYNNRIKIVLKFPGLAFDLSQEKRIKKIFKDVIKNINITKRIPRSEVLRIQKKSNLLLMFPHENLKGIPSSKLYEYIGLEKPVLLYPSDNDIIEKTLKDTNLGIICQNEETLSDTIKTMIEDFLNDKKNKIQPNRDKIKFYSRKYQTKKLSILLDNI